MNLRPQILIRSDNYPIMFESLIDDIALAFDNDI